MIKSFLFVTLYTVDFLKKCLWTVDENDYIFFYTWSILLLKFIERKQRDILQHLRSVYLLLFILPIASPIDTVNRIPIVITDEDPIILTLTLAGLVGKEEGREGGEKKHAQRARRTLGSNPGPAAC